MDNDQIMLLATELRRILAETTQSAYPAEVILVKQHSIALDMILKDLPVNVKRMTVEVLHKMYCIEEGLIK